MSCFRRSMPVLIGILLLPGSAVSQDPLPGRAVHHVLRPGELAERVLPTGAVHSYLVTAPAGQYFRAELDQPPASFYFRVYDPAGTRLVDAWTSCRDDSACAVEFFTEVDGRYRIELRSFAAEFPEHAADLPDISYRLQLSAAPSETARAERERLRAAISWLSANTHPLLAVEAGRGFEDLLPLSRILAGVRVVGLGEGTHGTREFFQVKHRLLEFLVTEMGFTLFGMEMDQGGARAINDFVLHGAGDGAHALAAQGMWQWDTEEVAALLEWMREYNRAAPERRKVRFVGFDFQVNDRGRDDVLEYLRRVAPDRVAAADSLLAPLVRRPDPARRALVEFYTLSPEQKSATAAGVRELFDFLDGRGEELAAGTSAAEYAEVLQSARRLVQFTDSHSRPGFEPDRPESGLATRDRYMAENIARVLDEAGPGAKMVVWSANEHVRRDPYNMGYHLGERYGDAYYALGFAFDRGGFRALEITGNDAPVLKEFTLGPAVQESVGWYMKHSGRSDAFVDFRGAPGAGPAAEWLARPHPMRSIGNGYAPGNPSGYYRAPVVLGTSYDGILFIEETTAARGRAPDRATGEGGETMGTRPGPLVGQKVPGLPFVPRLFPSRAVASSTPFRPVSPC